MTARGLRGHVVVLAPFGVSDAEQLAKLLALVDAEPTDITVVIPAGRPSGPVRQAGAGLVTVAVPRTVRGGIAALRALLTARRRVTAEGTRTVVFEGSGWLAPFEWVSRAGARALGAREVLRVTGDGTVARQRVGWDVRGAGAAAAANARAYRTARSAVREVDAARPPQRAGGPLHRVLYLRADTGLLATDEPGGSRSHMEGVIGGLQDNGLAVVAATPRPVSALRRPPPEHLPLALPSLADLHGELGEAVLAAAVTRRLLGSPRPRVDLVYQRYGLFAGSGLLLAQRLNVPFVLEVNCSEVRFRRQYDAITFGSLAARFEATLFSRASLVVAVSQRVADEVNEIAPDARVLLLPNGVDVDAFRADPEEAQSARDRIAVPPDATVVGFFGRFYQWHGIETLTRAAEAFLAARDDMWLLLVGDGPGREAAEMALLHWGERVRFTGIVPHVEVPALMSACDILVAPHAPIEGFIGSPMKLFEYLASGRAVVASRLEQMAEVVEDDRNGVLVTPGDSDELAAAVLHLAADPNLRRRLGAAARRSAVDEHSWATKMRELLLAVQGEASPPWH